MSRQSKCHAYEGILAWTWLGCASIPAILERLRTNRGPETGRGLGRASARQHERSDRARNLKRCARTGVVPEPSSIRRIRSPGPGCDLRRAYHPLGLDSRGRGRRGPPRPSARHHSNRPDAVRKLERRFGPDVAIYYEPKPCACRFYRELQSPGSPCPFAGPAPVQRADHPRSAAANPQQSADLLGRPIARVHQNSKGLQASVRMPKAL